MVMAKQCICEICTCGRHHCPHRPMTGPRGECRISEYTNRYRQHPIDMRPGFKPQSETRPSDKPMEDKTNNRIDYVAHALEKPYVRDPILYKRPDIPMEMQTSYNQNYLGKVAPPPKAIRHMGQKKVSGRFDAEPTYRADYRKWDIDRRKHCGPDYCWVAPSVKFEGMSSQKNDYPGYVEPMRESFKPQARINASDEPISDNTDYRQSYIRHAMPPKFVRDKELWKSPGVPVDGVTTFRRDYLGKQAPKVASCKPAEGKVGSDAPLENMTTVRDDYREWPTSKPKFHEYAPYVKPDGPIDGSTTYNTTYRPKYGEQAKACRPQPGRRTGGPFDGVTNYMQEYKKWEGMRPPKALMKPQLVVSDAPFAGISTQKAHYLAYPNADRTQLCKPLRSTIGSDAPFDDSTMYRMNYTGRMNDPCPVITIETTDSRYAYDGQDTRGHKFYLPKMATGIVSPVQATPVPMQRQMTVA